jgi:NAD(P)-dependent dehydrogenase (short-subunit alcohol dehydrogenase family)
MADNRETAIIVGAGTGLGAALARRFSRAEMNVAMAVRNPARIEALAAEYCGLNHSTIAVACDGTREADVQALFQRAASELGPPRLVVYNAGGFVRKALLETSVEDFERSWKAACLGGFLVGREAVRAMLAQKGDGNHRGTVIFTGATASLRGGATFHNFAVGKFGLRALSQSMAREFQPKGIHVGHVIIDGQIESNERPGRSVAERGADAVLSPDAIAEAYWQLHLQKPSAWTLELDLRPYVEKF